MSMGRRISKSWAEVDLRSRHVYLYLQRPGVTAKIKRVARRRERSQAKREIRRGEE